MKKILSILFAVGLLAVAPPYYPFASVTANAANTTYTFGPIQGASMCSIGVSGTWTGAITAGGYNRGSTVNTPVNTRYYNNDSYTTPSITADGLYYASVAGLNSLTLLTNGAFTGSAVLVVTCDGSISFMSHQNLALPVTVANGGTGASTLASAPFAVLNPSTAQTGAINVTGTITAAQLVPNADGYIIEYSGAPNIGRVFLGNTGGAYLDFNGTNYTLGNGGPLSFANSITQPGYAQHGIVSVTTPSSCTALATCTTVSATFTTAMVNATYSCNANSENYPYNIYISAKSTTSVTFTLSSLVAVSSAQTVPVDYRCSV